MNISTTLLADEVTIDFFCGGGGLSEAAEQALGRPIDFAVNHDPKALAMHAANHPRTTHLCEDVFHVDMNKYLKGRPVGFWWFSPDCTEHSKAKGGKPVQKNIRCLAWVVLKCAATFKPRVIGLENVEEFKLWGMAHRLPSSKKDRRRCKLCHGLYDGRPCPQHKGVTFKRWCTQLRNLGYQLEFRELAAHKYGAPTIRKRLFVIARRDGNQIAWPEPTHGPGLLPYRTAAECLDFSIPCPSIFMTKTASKKLRIIRPLADKTLARIAKGVQKYVLGKRRPFIVQLTHAGSDRVYSVDDPINTVTGQQRGDQAVCTPILSSLYGAKSDGDHRCHSPEDPAQTITASQRHAVITPTLVQTGYGEREGQAPRALDIEQPIGTLVSGGKHALVSSFLARYNSTKPGGNERTSSVEDPLPVQPTENRFANVSVFLERDFGKSIGSGADEPVGTITSGGGGKTAVVAATIMHATHENQSSPPDKPLNTVMTGNHHGLIETTLIPIIGQHQGGEPARPGKSADEPLPTITQRATQIPLIAVHITQHNSQRGGDGINPGRPADQPIATITASGGQTQLVASTIVKMHGTTTAQPIDEPLHTIAAGGRHYAEVRCFLKKYLGEDVEPIVTIDGETYIIVDIGMRMLSARELFRCQGFPESYRIDGGRDVCNAQGSFLAIGGEWIQLTKTEQIRMCGNSVSPPPAAALIRAQFQKPALRAAA